MKKYYISYLADFGCVAMNCLQIVEATDIGNAYRKIGAGLFHGEEFSTDEEALLRLRSGKDCSVAVCFLIPEYLQALSVESLSSHFKNDINVATAFRTSNEKAVNSKRVDECPKVLRDAIRSYHFAKPLNILRKFERAFRWEGIFEKKQK